ncbi:hypothetical protein BCR39DRAFT_154288 [Naematelia encephala]|uniref:Uncharacterized protein n=1 Tax=Naematelia encephala TaxID=71784 RepID=A0A1Y2B5V3_9TREE|nr:hypothetical protein BCR39DRAFT_154288 [Naematelia encephala]
MEPSKTIKPSRTRWGQGANVKESVLAQIPEGRQTIIRTLSDAGLDTATANESPSASPTQAYQALLYRLSKQVANGRREVANGRRVVRGKSHPQPGGTVEVSHTVDLTAVETPSSAISQSHGPWATNDTYGHGQGRHVAQNLMHSPSSKSFSYHSRHASDQTARVDGSGRRIGDTVSYLAGPSSHPASHQSTHSTQYSYVQNPRHDGSIKGPGSTSGVSLPSIHRVFADVPGVFHGLAPRPGPRPGDQGHSYNHGYLSQQSQTSGLGRSSVLSTSPIQTSIQHPGYPAGSTSQFYNTTSGSGSDLHTTSDFDNNSRSYSAS